MSTLEIIIGFLSVTNLTTAIGFFYTLKASRRKANSESKISDFEATEKIIAIYKDLSADLTKHYNQRIDFLDKKVNDLQQRINELNTLKCNNTKCPNRT